MLRDFAGVQPVTFDPALSQKALAAAVMMRAAGTLSHGPGTSWPCYSCGGSRGAPPTPTSAQFYWGASAMTAYVQDLGHRGPVLDPRVATMGTGSTDSTNALWIYGAPGGPRYTTPR